MAFALQRELKGHSHSVASVKFSPDGERLATAGEDGTVRVWGVKTGAAELEVQAHSSGALLDPGASESSARGMSGLRPMRAGVSDVAWSRGGAGEEGEHLLTASDDCTLALWRVKEGKKVRELRGHMKPVFCCAFSPAGGVCASGSEDESVRLWDPQAGECSRAIPAHCDPVTSVDFSRGGERLCTGSFDGTIRVWEVATGECALTFTCQVPSAPPVACARFTPNCRYIAAAYMRSAALLAWLGDTSGAPEDQQESLCSVRRLAGGHSCENFASFLAFPASHDRGHRSLLVGSEDGSPCLYDIQSGTVSQHLPSSYSQDGSRSPVVAVDAHPNQPIVATASLSPDCSVRIWASS